MEQSSGSIRAGHDPDDVEGAAARVFQGILEDLERHAMVPGQRLIETELAQRFGVGRNAVREAMQKLAARGVADLTRNRSASIRRLDDEEIEDVLDVASTLTGLAMATAAARYDAAQHRPRLAASIDALIASADGFEPGGFGRARRSFYRTILWIGRNRELARLFPAVAMHIVYAQFPSQEIQRTRIDDYRAMGDAIIANDAPAAEREGRAHVERVRAILRGSGQRRPVAR